MTCSLSTAPIDTAFHWRGEGDKLVVVSVLDVVWRYGRSWVYVHLLQAVLVSLSVRFFPVYPAEWRVLNGKETVVLKGVSVVV